MALSDDLIIDIAAVLDDPDYGRDVTLRRYTPGAYDPATSATASGTTASVTTRGILLGYKDYVIVRSDGMIQRGDRRVILKVNDLSFDPAIGDQIIAGNSVYAVVDSKLVELGGNNIVWILQLRGQTRS